MLGNSFSQLPSQSTKESGKAQTLGCRTTTLIASLQLETTTSRSFLLALIPTDACFKFAQLFVHEVQTSLLQLKAHTGTGGNKLPAVLLI
jgi:hypothetical protein